MPKSNNQKRKLLFAAKIVIFGVIATFLTYLMSNNIKKSLYIERKSALTQLINTATQSINNAVKSRWEIANVYEQDVNSHLSQADTVEDYLAYLDTQIVDEGDLYFLVDSTGKYYSSDGVTGNIVETKYYHSDTEEETEYLGQLSHLGADNTYLILRSRLDQPIETKNKNGTAVTIKYCALLHDVSSLVEYINTLFEGNNNTIIYDTDTGLMLYKNFGIRLLINGYNIYDKYKKAELLYGDDGETAISEVKNRKMSVTTMEVAGEKYYLCSTPLEISNWSLMLVVEGEYFNSISGDAFSNVITSIGVSIFVIASLIIILFLYLGKLNISKKNLEYELKANKALNEAYEMKSTFLSYMSHDIRTPINGMIGMSKIGLSNSTDKEKVEECFRKIDLSSKHLLAIVNDVLDMSALESGKVVISSERMDVVDTVESCVTIISGTLNGRDLTIEKNYDCPVSGVLGDEFHLKQIIINILSNAVKFTEDGGKITVSCRQLDEQDDFINYEISIADTGCGMTEEFKSRIFEAFSTVNPDGKAKYKGSGLGMAITNAYVGLMNGTINVDSEINVGSTFTIVLPFGKLKKSDVKIELQECNILLVDDNDMNLEIAEEMLEDQVKSITVAHDGKEALDLFTSSKVKEFSLILMDVQMPVMNGYEAAKAIRESGREDSDVRIIALTANTYKDDIDKIFESGMDGYLNKPFSVKQLIDKISVGG